MFELIFKMVQFLSAGSLGLFAGSMLTEACVLVPYWRSLEPPEFLGWYGKNGHRLQGFFGPLTIITGLLAIAAAGLSVWQGLPGRWLLLAAAVIIVLVISTFYIYFGKANASFTAAPLPVKDVPSELVRWATWHWWRTGLSFLALAAALLSLWRHQASLFE